MYINRQDQAYLMVHGDIASKRICIGNDVWICINAVVLPGTTIEDGAVIGANVVANKRVGKGEIWTMGDRTLRGTRKV